MKRIFTLFFLCLMAVAAWAGIRVVVFDPAEDYGYTPAVVGDQIIEKDCVTLNISNGLITGSHYRIYKGQTLTICVCSGNIIKVEFQCTASGEAQYGPGCFVPNVGDYTYEGLYGVWTGSFPCVQFTAVTNQVRLTKVIVTVEDGTVSAPVISPASGTYYEQFWATISCYDPEAVIHYTTDGSDPDVQSAVYTAPILVDRDMTIKAVSELDGEMSDVATTSYHVINNVDQYGCFGDLDLLPEGTPVRFTSPIYALAQQGNYLYAKDACGGCALIWGRVGQTYSLGDVIPAGFVVTKSFYSGEMELNEPNNFKPAMENITIAPDTITTAQLGHDLFAHYVWIHKVKIDTERRVLIDEDGNEIPYYNSLNATIPVALDKWYDVHGIIGSYAPQNSDVIYQFLPVRFTPCDDDNQEGVGLGNYWKYFDPVNPNPYEVTFDYDATVLLQAGSYLYAKDETGYGLIYGQVGQTYKHGDVIPAGYGGKVFFYDGWPELASPLSGFQPPKANVEVIPEETTIPQVGPDLWGHYVIIKNVIVDKEKGVIRDENGNELPIYVRFGLTFTYPDETLRIDIRGIVSAYKGDFQLLVWDIDDEDPEPIDCLQDYYNLENPNAAFLIKLVVIYQYGANLYARDLCGDYILMYGNINGQFVNGDIIEGVARMGEYQKNRQLIPEGDWVKVGHGLPVEPETGMCTEEVAQDMCHWYVRIENVEIVNEGDNTYIEDECGRLLLFNKFYTEIPGPEPEHPIAPPRNPYDLNNDGELNIADINTLIDMILTGQIDYDWTWMPQSDGTMKWDVTGFLGVYNSLLELYPVEITPASGGIHIVGDMNFDGELNIADLNALLDTILSR